MLAAGLLFMAGASMAWAGETTPFDPEQPFRQGFSTSVLRSLLNEALDALEDRLEITGNLVPDGASGSRQGHLRFKFYPDGKSHSDRHHMAEGWFRLSPDDTLGDFYFRFKNQEEPAKDSLRQFGDVL
jgi:hypothetical protein